MTIVDKIKKSVKDVLGEDHPVYYNDDPGANLETGRMTFPCCVIRMLTTGTADKAAGQVRETVSAALFFLRLMKGMDFSPERNEHIIDRCKKDAFAWYGSLNLNHDLELVALSRTSRVYEEYDDIVTGFGMLCDLRERTGSCIAIMNENQNNE